MKIKMNRNIGRILLAGACATALAVGTAVPAFAVDKTGTTSVSYSSSQQVEGANGWGFEVPTSIPFGPDKAKTVDASVNLYNTTPGQSVGQIPDFPVAGADLYVSSLHGYKLMRASTPNDPVNYQIVWGHFGTGTDVTADSTADDTGGKKIKVGNFDRNNDKLTGTATRTSDAKQSGSHIDTLTFYYNDSNEAIPAA